ncbi:hypothetical protein J4G37_53825, partial [Microvirga sp. 3-52]|nr:hypothetical protein [Microvirga sp. 3-52]
IRVESDISDVITVREVGLVPSDFPMYENHDDNILRIEPGLFPDPLYPIGSEGIPARQNQWRSIWVTVKLNNNIKSDTYKICIKFETVEAGTIAEENFHLEVIDESLPKSKLIQTNWFHTDCIAT